MLQFERTDLAKVLPYQDAAFDHIVSVSVLQSVPDPVFTLQEFRRILKPEGLVIITHSPKPDTHHIPLKQHVGRQSGHASKKTF